MDKTNYRYYAFISYSSKDEACAKKLHKKIEHYRIPRSLVGRPGRDGEIPHKIFPVFRDRDELPLSSDLGSTIQDALSMSRYLIVICSPNSAVSEWVNEEVRYFKEIGRGDRILALILDGEPNADDERECFPPALKYFVLEDGSLDFSSRVEPIAGDLRQGKDGWKSCFLKAVAGITGAGYNAFVKRERRRGRIRAACVALVSLCLIVGAIAWWDYTRTKVHYYAHMGERWGIPEGIVELSAEQVSGRERSYMIESSRRKVRRVSSINGAFKLRDDPDKFNAAIWNITYSEQGPVSSIIFSGQNGNVTCQMDFSELEGLPDSLCRFVEYKSKHLQAPLFVQSKSNDAQGKTEISSRKVVYTEDGLLESEFNLNAYRYPRSDSLGSFGKRYEYNELNLPAAEIYIGADGHRGRLKSGVSKKIYVRNNHGAIVEIAHLSLTDTPISNKLGYCYERRKYDADGRLIEQSYYGDDGGAVIGGDGYHRVVWGPFSEHGSPLGGRVYGADGSATTDNTGVSIMKYEYDHNGYQTRASFYNSAGIPAWSNLHESYAVSQKFDARGNILERSYWGASHDPLLLKEGVHKQSFQYDQKGNRVDIANFGKLGNPVLLNGRYHRIKLTYNARDFIETESYFDEYNEPTQDGEGVHKYKADYDERGNKTKVWAYGVDDLPVINRAGWHLNVKRYDNLGHIVEEAHFDINTKPCVINEDSEVCHKSVWIHDGSGNVKSHAFYGASGEPIAPIGDLHKFSYDYDEYGRKVREYYFGIDGLPVSDDGYHMAKFEYDDRGYITSESYFDSTGAPCITADGYHLVKSVWDENGNEICYEFFGVGGEPVPGSDGIHRTLIEYDARGNQTGLSFYGSDNQPVLHSEEGHHKIVYEYNDRDKPIGQAYFGADMAPVSVRGVHELEWDYDERGNKIVEIIYGPNKEAAYSHQTHKALFDYDDRGNRISVSWFDGIGNPCLHSVGVHKTIYSYDELGNTLVEAYFGLNNEPVNMVGVGIHKVQYLYDQSHKLLSQIYFDANGRQIE